MSFEKLDFSDTSRNDVKVETSPEASIVDRTKDNLDFECEYCMDREGGCAQCGFASHKRG